MTDLAQTVALRRLAWGCAVLGFALGGFFDGIVLHQILQWHHLFSLVPGETWRDIRMQILMDGWFHVLHYVIACGGLWLLWVNRAGFAGMGGDRRLIGAALLGFGAWQVVDDVLFHWILVIHRIRVDVPNPLAYDLGWLAAFGLTSLAAGMWLMRSRGGSGGAGRRAAAGLAALTLLAGPVAGRPMPGGATVVVFRAGVDAPSAFAATARPGARILWADLDHGLMAVSTPENALSYGLALYGQGALLVSSTPALGGCLGWSNQGAAPAPI